MTKTLNAVELELVSGGAFKLGINDDHDSKVEPATSKPAQQPVDTSGDFGLHGQNSAAQDSVDSIF